MANNMTTHQILSKSLVPILKNHIFICLFFFPYGNFKLKTINK